MKDQIADATVFAHSLLPRHLERDTILRLYVRNKLHNTKNERLVSIPNSLNYLMCWNIYDQICNYNNKENSTSGK